MAKYTVRVTNDEQGINAWIDQDGLKCIMQPNMPGETSLWSSEAEALTWATAHAAELEAQYEAGLVAAAREQELKDLQLAAAQAQIDTAAHLKSIVDALIAK
jgi:hypothetical protein